MKRPKRTDDFEWTFSTRLRERECHQCPAMTTGSITNLRTGLRKPLCSTCFFAAVKSAAPTSLPRKRPASAGRNRETEQLRLC